MARTKQPRLTCLNCKDEIQPLCGECADDIENPKPKLPYTDRDCWISEVIFMDHSKGAEAPMKCKAWGLLVDENDAWVRLYSWISDGDASDLENAEFVNILKSTVLEVRKIALSTPNR